jgi:hypothetical protein
VLASRRRADKCRLLGETLVDSAWFRRLKVEYRQLLSTVALSFNLRRNSEADELAEGGNRHVSSRGLHSSTAQPDVSTFWVKCLVYRVVPVTKMALVQPESGRVDGAYTRPLFVPTYATFVGYVEGIIVKRCSW